MNANAKERLEAQMDCRLHQDKPVSAFSLSCSRGHSSCPYRGAVLGFTRMTLSKAYKDVTSLSSCSTLCRSECKARAPLAPLTGSHLDHTQLQADSGLQLQGLSVFFLTLLHKFQHTERPRQEDRLRPGVGDQPGRHSKTPILQKTYKLARHNVCVMMVRSGCCPKFQRDRAPPTLMAVREGGRKRPAASPSHVHGPRVVEMEPDSLESRLVPVLARPQDGFEAVATSHRLWASVPSTIWR
ncbi:hypothetical protein AAY473_029517 [Plecturocebus cupreus]